MRLMRSALFIAVLILLLICIAPVSALQVNFQNTGTDLTELEYLYFGSTLSASYGLTYNISGGNNYIWLYHTRDGAAAGRGQMIFRNRIPLQTTYAAATYLTYSGSIDTLPGISLFDSVGALMWDYPLNGTVSDVPKRYEVKMAGGTAYVYQNGNLIITSPALAQNPSYVGFGTYDFGNPGNPQYTYWDDFVYGDTANKYIFDMPQTDVFVIKKDLLTPAASGFCYANGTIISSNYMPTRYSQGAIGTPPDPRPNETIELINYVTGNTYAIKYTYNAYQGAQSWDINTALISSGAPYGFYQLRIFNATLESDTIAYIGMGATITWDRATYSANDVATVTYTISPAYFDVATYTYTAKVVDIYGTSYDTQSITSPTGTYTVTLDSTDYDPGYYFAEVIATPNAGGSDIIMNYDSMQVVNYLVISGYVLNATTAFPLPKANITIYQGTTVVNKTSGFDGNYTTLGTTLYPDYDLWINTSAIGFDFDNHTWKPLLAKTYNVNISMLKNNPYPAFNVTLGGIARLAPYYTPLESTTVPCQNATYGAYLATTNLAGYYDCRSLENNVTYSVWGSKSGFTNSTTYWRLVTGV